MNPEPSFTKLLKSLSLDEQGQWSTTITENWMQGRTTYGGFSAALCLEAVLKQYPDLPPLRSAQINFTGPVGGNISINTKILSQGRSVSYLLAELTGEKGLAVHAVFCFGVTRDSKLCESFNDKPKVPTVEQSKDFFGFGPAPAFTQNYQCRLAKGAAPISGSDKNEHYLWVKHNDNSANDLCALVGIADMPPPAVLPMFKEFAPISSMTWMFNILSQDITTEDGWWLLRSAAEHAENGYSSQDMQVWNSNGDLIITGRQNVAIFY